METGATSVVRGDKRDAGRLGIVAEWATRDAGRARRDADAPLRAALASHPRAARCTRTKLSSDGTPRRSGKP